MNIIGDIIIGDILHLIEKSPADSAAIALITLSAIRRCDKNFFKGITIFSWLLLIGAALAAFPVFVIFMVTGGDLRLLSAGQVGGSADQIALVFDFLIPCFLVVLPSLLRPRLPWGSDPDRTDVQELVPTWLAISAAAATAGLVITLHFVKGGQLANMRPTLVIAAIVGFVFLVFPLYSLLARACWQRGYRMVFSGRARVGREQGAAWNFVWKAIRPTWRPSAPVMTPSLPPTAGEDPAPPHAA